jgi:SPW repeat
MSTHFTRRGGTPAGSDREHAEITPERRFRTERDEAAGIPVSPLVEEQQDPAMRRTAPVRDHASAPPPGPAGGWRDTVRTASGLNVLAGIWLIIAPFVLGYGGGDPHWNDILFGAITGLIALARVAGALRASWLSWVNAAIGVWIFVSAFWLDATSTAKTNDIVLGAIVFVLAIASATASDQGVAAERRGLRA